MEERTMEAAESEKNLKLEGSETVETDEPMVEVEPAIESPIMALEPDSAKRKRRELSLSEKVQLIHESQSTTKSQRMLATVYQIGKTTVHEILKKKDEILRAYEENFDSGGRKRVCTRSVYGDINRLAWQWYERMRSQGNQVTGPMLQEKARSFAADLDMKEFRASNGWLEGFRRRHGISFNASFHSYETSVNVTTEWTEKILEVTEGYRSTDIFNLVETGLYYKVLPDKSLAPDPQNSSASTDRLTVTLCCNMDGEYEKPIVIGHVAKPPCFRNLDLEGLPVLWRANRRAWITTTIFAEWLRSLDRRMRQQDRRILLFLDNSPPHPPALQLTNIKLVFLIKPSNNTVNQLQPLTQGIVDAFRMAYRRKVLSSTLAKLDDSYIRRDPMELMKDITALDACFWIASTLDEISGSTMIKCFEAAGFLVNLPSDSSLSSYSMAFPLQRVSPAVGSSPLNTSTPRKTNKGKSKVTGRMPRIPTGPVSFEELLSTAAYRIHLKQPMTIKEYTTFDSKLKVADDLSEGWEERLVEDFCDNKKSNATEEAAKKSTSEGSAVDDTQTDPETGVGYLDALSYNRNLMMFAVQENDSEMLTALYKVEAQMQRTHLKKLFIPNHPDIEALNSASANIQHGTTTQEKEVKKTTKQKPRADTPSNQAQIRELVAEVMTQYRAEGTPNNQPNLREEVAIVMIPDDQPHLREEVAIVMTPNYQPHLKEEVANVITQYGAEGTPDNQSHLKEEVADVITKYGSEGTHRNQSHLKEEAAEVITQYGREEVAKVRSQYGVESTPDNRPHLREEAPKAMTQYRAKGMSDNQPRLREEVAEVMTQHLPRSDGLPSQLVETVVEINTSVPESATLCALMSGLPEVQM